MGGGEKTFKTSHKNCVCLPQQLLFCVVGLLPSKSFARNMLGKLWLYVNMRNFQERPMRIG